MIQKESTYQVGIVIPIYNDEVYLSQTLDCIMAQTYTNWVCVLVNDGSTDRTQDVIDTYCVKDRRFVSYPRNNSGCADIPIEFGMGQLKTPYCLFMGHDDIIEPAYIKKMVTRQQETGADIVSPTMIYCKHQLEGEIWRLPCEPIHYEDVLSGPDACAHTIGGWHLTTNGMLYRTELNTGIVRGHYMNSDEFSSRQILYKADKVAFSDAKYLYRQYTNSVSRKMSARLWERMFVDLEIVDFVLSRYADLTIRKNAISAQYFNLVHLVASAYLDSRIISPEHKKLIREWALTAFKQTNKEILQKYLPSHRIMYRNGDRWFVISSIIYVLVHRIKGKKYEYK